MGDHRVWTKASAKKLSDQMVVHQTKNGANAPRALGGMGGGQELRRNALTAEPTHPKQKTKQTQKKENTSIMGQKLETHMQLTKMEKRWEHRTKLQLYSSGLKDHNTFINNKTKKQQ